MAANYKQTTKKYTFIQVILNLILMRLQMIRLIQSPKFTTKKKKTVITFQVSDIQNIQNLQSELLDFLDFGLRFRVCIFLNTLLN